MMLDREWLTVMRDATAHRWLRADLIDSTG